jgi:hypothetical protein
MKKYFTLLLSILLIEIYSSHNYISSKDNSNSNNINSSPQPNNTEKNNSQFNTKNNSTLQNGNNNKSVNQSNRQKKVEEEKKVKANNNANLTNAEEINEKKEKDKKKEDKPFNLTESLINFFKETFGDNDDKEKKKDESINRTKEEIEAIRRRNEEQMRRREMEARERRRKEEFESRVKAEKIRMEKKQKEERKKKAREERDAFERSLVNVTFEDFIHISLEKGETEKIYLNLEKQSKVKLALILTDEEEKFNFLITGPNEFGNIFTIYKDNDRNFLFYHFIALSKGEFTLEITNKGSKENELIFLLNEHAEKKKDIINTEKIDKISLLLNNIFNNMDQLKNKKRIEIQQVRAHEDKVDKNNRAIVIYSIVEIFIMIIVFITQSYYINHIVSKL